MNYPGGKGQVFQRLINLMPPHEVYIETHLGGGSIIRNKLPARQNIGIEIDPTLIGTWRTINTHTNIESLKGWHTYFFRASTIMVWRLNGYG